MSPLIWISIISIVLIVTLIGYKSFENSKGGVIFAPVFRKRADDFIENQIQFLSRLGNFLFKKMLKYLSGIPHKVNGILHNLWRKISGKVDGYFERLRGHHNIVKKD